MHFNLDSAARRRLGYKLIDRIDEYFSSLSTRPVQLPFELRSFDDLKDSMPELGEDAERVLEDVCGELISKGFHVPSANYFGLMNCTPTYMAVLAEALVAALNPQLATLARSQLASKIERETLRWLGERVGWKTPFDGTFTSGGNEANFSALALALAAHFPDSVENGVASIGKQPVLYTSSEAHHSLDKSAGLLGLGRKALRRIAVNERVQLDPERLETQIKLIKKRGTCLSAWRPPPAPPTPAPSMTLRSWRKSAAATSSGFISTARTVRRPSFPTSTAIWSAESKAQIQSPSIRTNGWPCPMLPARS
jgi:hypothetical protein